MSAIKFDGKRYHQTVVWRNIAVLIYNTPVVMFDDKRYHRISVWLEVLQSCIYNTSAEMFDNKHYLRTVVCLEVLHTWYITRQLWCLMANTTNWLLYDEVAAAKNRFKLPPPVIYYYYWPFQGDASVVVYSNCQYSSVMVVLDLLFNLLRIALWPSVGKELSPWLFSCAVFYFSAVLNVGVPFPFWCLGQDMEFDLSVPDRCLLQHVSCDVWWYTLSSGCCMTWSVAFLI